MPTSHGLSKSLGLEIPLFLGIFLVLLPQAGWACVVCVDVPERSAADWLIESSCVIFARENPAQPFSYSPVEVLKESGPKKAQHEPIDLFLDSHTRRILAANPDQVVVLVYDAQAARWRQLGLADTGYAAIVRRIVLLGPQWQGPEGAKARLDFFLPLFGHKNPAIYELAYLELGRAPYRTIQELSRVVPREQLEPILKNRLFLQWRPLAIVMLAQSKRPDDHQFIRQSFRSAERFGLTSNLAAWATAAIELDGAEAVEFIQRRYFRQASRQRTELTEIIKATSLHGNQGRTELRDQIVASYATLLEVHPELAESVARDLLAWRRTELTEQLAVIFQASDYPEARDFPMVRRYLSQTAAVSAQASRP